MPVGVWYGTEIAWIIYWGIGTKIKAPKLVGKVRYGRYSLKININERWTQNLRI